jgi:hypothetical protein
MADIDINWVLILFNILPYIFPLFLYAVILGIFFVVRYLNNRGKASIVEYDTKTGVPDAVLFWKSKKIAVVLAVLFGPFTWLYTYRRDAWKAAVGLAIFFNGLILLGGIYYIDIFMTKWYIVRAMPFYEVIVTYMIPLEYTWLPVWIWAVLDTALQKKWVLNGVEAPTRNAAVTISFFFLQWTWLYTYKKDAGKFWLSAILLYGSVIAFVILTLPPLLVNRYVIENDPVSIAPVIIAILIIWTMFISSLVISARRPNEWYDNYNM